MLSTVESEYYSTSSVLGNYMSQICTKITSFVYDYFLYMLSVVVVKLTAPWVKEVHWTYKSYSERVLHVLLNLHPPVIKGNKSTRRNLIENSAQFSCVKPFYLALSKYFPGVYSTVFICKGIRGVVFANFEVFAL